MVVHMSDNEKLVRSLLSAIAAGANPAAHFHPDAEQIEYPSLMRPAGHRRPLADMVAGFELGKSIIAGQHYDVHTVIEQDDRLSVQLTWTATTAAPVGGLPAGTGLTAHVAVFYEFREGLILRQSSYDCYQPLTR